MAFRNWQDLSSAAIAALDAARTVAVLPLAATEQHGPHLPTGTDQFIADGLIGEASRRCPADLDIVVMPVQPIGSSDEHSRFPGTLSMPASLLTELITALGGSVARAGLRKLVLVSAHGGNVPALMNAALECRLRHRLVAATLTFARLGLPNGFVEPEEAAFGVHGGLIETALMMHFRADLVDISKAANFRSLQADLAGRFTRLRAHGPIGFGWLAGDLNSAGVTGNAADATAAIGAAIAAHQATAFVEFLQELAQADVASMIKGD
jgi:creatinine amidohydrolase